MNTEGGGGGVSHRKRKSDISQDSVKKSRNEFGSVIIMTVPETKYGKYKLLPLHY